MTSKAITILAVLGMFGCSNDTIEGEYLPNMGSFIDPKLKRSEVLFSSYKVHVYLTIKSDKAFMIIKGQGIDNKTELRLQRKGGKVIIRGPKDNSSVAEFITTGAHSIRCTKCPSGMPQVWTRAASLSETQ